MKRILFYFFFFVTAFTINAQGSFVKRIQTEVPGQGKVVIVQSDSIQKIVENGHVKDSYRSNNGVKKSNNENASENDGKETEERTHHKPVIGGEKHKSRGYRVQIYTGGNSRADKNAAVAAGNRCRKAFPELSVYTHFSSPKWVCVVGDFKDSKQANKYAESIRRAGISKEARIVPSEVYVSR